MARSLQRLTDLFGHQVYLSWFGKAYSHQPLKLLWLDYLYLSWLILVDLSWSLLTLVAFGGSWWILVNVGWSWLILVLVIWPQKWKTKIFFYKLNVCKNFQEKPVNCQKKIAEKNLTYERHWILWPMWIVSPLPWRENKNKWGDLILFIFSVKIFF